MKILFLNYWAQHLGGAEYSLIDIISNAAINNETVLITSEDGSLTEHAKKSGCTCISLPCNVNISSFKRERPFFSILLHLRSLLSFIYYCLKVNKKVKDINPHVIHSNVPKSHIILFLIVLAGFKKPSIIHIREIFNRYSIPYFLYALLFNPKYSSVIAISNAVQKSLPIALYKKSVVIYNGVSVPHKIVCSSKERINPPRFLYLGRVVPWKGCDLLIDAFRLLYDKYGPDAGTLSIVGGTFYWNSIYRETLQHKIASLDLNDTIFLNEFTTNISSIFLSHTIFCLPSFQEPFGRVAAEAMAHELPVLGFQSGGLPEIVSHNVTGLLAPTRSIESMFHLMSTCIQKSDEVFQMGINGRKRCLELFNKEIQISKIVSAITAKPS